MFFSAVVMAAWSFLLIPFLSPCAWATFPSSYFFNHEQEPTPSFLSLTRRKPSSLPPAKGRTIVHTLRFHQYNDHTRIVLDLTQSPSYETHQRKRDRQIVIQLNHSTLSSKARKQFHQKDFPSSVSLRQTKRKNVLVTLNMTKLSSYHVLTLHNPHRLVLDLYPSSSKTTVPVVSTPTKKNHPLPKLKRPLPSNHGKPFLIVIDPGHGGKDPGAIGKRGTKEKDVVLKIAQQVRKMIAKQLHAKVLMTRTKDIFVELEDRVQFANSHNADLFVSIHVNSHPRRYVKGLEIYHFEEASDPRALEVAARENGTPLDKNGPPWQFILADKLNDKKIKDSREFAWTTKKTLLTSLKSHYQLKDHGVKTAPFYVLRMTTMPGILAEVAFVSNPTEEKYLSSRTFRQRVAKGIFQGIQAYVGPMQTASR